jgi:glycosyltransferase involved in cell wall biosynthesis
VPNVAIDLAEFDVAAAATMPAVAPGHRLRVLVRSGPTPLGYVDLVGDGRPVGAADLVRLGRASLGGRLWANVLTRGYTLEGRDVDPPAVSVVVCTRDRASLLDGCLEALAAQDHPRYEVIVVDNAPRDDTARIVCERRGVRYLVEPLRGLDRARNAGLGAATFELVAYTDDDARPDPGWLGALANGFSAEGVQCVTGLVVPAELQTEAQVLFEDAYGGMGKGFVPTVFPPARARLMRPERCGAGCNMAFRRLELARIGGFDPVLDVGTPTGGGGDLDAFQRVLEAGGTILYRPDAIVRHYHRRTVSELRRQLYDNGRAYVAVLGTAYGRADRAGRIAVVRRGAAWIASWLLARPVRRVVRQREELPLLLILAELQGALRGRGLLRRSRREDAAQDG